MDKAPDAFRTISEVAEDLDLPQHVLRFWETRFPQIKPLKRGGGRRYYRPDDVLLLRGIRHLLYGEGYTIKGVQRILKESGPRAVQAAWQQGEEAAAPHSMPETVQLPSAGLGDSRDDVDIVEMIDDDGAWADEQSAADAGPSAVAQAPEPVERVAPRLPPAEIPPALERVAPHPANVSMVRGGLSRQTPRPETVMAGPQADGPPPTPAAGLSADDVQSLKAVLYELLETRKGLELALNRR